MSIVPDRREHAQVEFQHDLQQVLDMIRQFLTEKNRKYGDAALNPNQTFSTASPIELINVRLDDKLSRVKNRQNDEDEDPELDIIGYLLLKQIVKMRAMQNFKKEADVSLAAAKAIEAELRGHAPVGITKV